MDQKTSRLLAAPREIRDIMYGHLTEDIFYLGLQIVRAPDWSILPINRQITLEYLETVFKQTSVLLRPDYMDYDRWLIPKEKNMAEKLFRKIRRMDIVYQRRQTSYNLKQVPPIWKNVQYNIGDIDLDWSILHVIRFSILTSEAPPRTALSPPAAIGPLKLAQCVHSTHTNPHRRRSDKRFVVSYTYKHASSKTEACFWTPGELLNAHGTIRCEPKSFTPEDNIAKGAELSKEISFPFSSAEGNGEGHLTS